MTVQRQVAGTQTVCVPRTVCKQVPVEVCVKVPVVSYCPPAAVMPSAQSVVASAQSQLPLCTVPPCDPCDAHHPLFRRLGCLLH